MTEEEPTYRYVIVVSPRDGTFAVLDKQTGRQLVKTHDAREARRLQELAEKGHREEQARLDALARAAGRPR